jgi:hypothetical protein
LDAEAAASNALVQAALNDSWHGLHADIARLFGRGFPDPATERLLLATRDELSAAAPGDLDNVRSRLVTQWETRLRDLVADYPNAQKALAALVQEQNALGELALEMEIVVPIDGG